MTSISPLSPAQAQRASVGRSFLRCLLTAFCLFLPFLIIDKGFFLYCGDFNSQQQPFTYHLEQLIKEGFAGRNLPSYSWATDLGTGFVEGYSFYLLGSPFFWLGTLLPHSWSPYLLAPLLCLKFAVAGAGATLWARRHTRTAFGAELVGVLYAFSGFAIYNIFFNHFLDVVAVFPFLLWSVDEFFENDRRAVFPLMTALCLFVNYFFFVGQVVFVLIYFVLHLIGRNWRITLRRFLLFALEALLGVGMAMVLALPSFFQVITNPRALDPFSGLGYLFYGSTQQYLNIFTSAFLPQDPPYLPNLFPGGAIKWTSMSLYLPFVGMAGVLTWLRGHRRSTFARLLLTCAVMALVPVLNSAFYAFNSSYYCRWYYMPLLVMAMATVRALEAAPRKEWLLSLRICGIITGCYSIFLLLPQESSDGGFTLGVADEPIRLLLTLVIAISGILLLFLLLRNCKTRAALLRCTMVFSCMMGALIGIYTITCGKLPQRAGDADYKAETYDYRLEIADWLNNADDSYFRIDTFESYTNLGLWLNRSCIQFFNSTVDPSIMEFYPVIGVKRDVSTTPDHNKYAVRGLMNVKYLLTPSDRVAEYYDEVSFSEDWISAAVIGSYTILENQNHVPFGTTYDYYITQAQYEALYEDNRANILLRALVLSDEQIAAYSDVLQPLPERSLSVMGYTAYTLDCADRAATAADSFTTDNDGFTAHITTDAPELVFFAVPYNEGWHATVNDAPAVVENVDNGLCAVRVDAGESLIRLEYEAPGYRCGALLSCVSLLLWALYAVLQWTLHRKAGAGYRSSAPTVAQELTALPPWQTPGESDEAICDADAVCDDGAPVRIILRSHAAADDPSDAAGATADDPSDAAADALPEAAADALPEAATDTLPETAADALPEAAADTLSEAAADALSEAADTAVSASDQPAAVNTDLNAPAEAAAFHVPAAIPDAASAASCDAADTLPAADISAPSVADAAPGADRP